jgi:hypothetical protein
MNAKGKARAAAGIVAPAFIKVRTQEHFDSAKTPRPVK